MFTNVKLHDEATKDANFTKEFRMKLICEQVEKQTAEIEALESEVKQCEKVLENTSASVIRMNIFTICLQKNSHGKLTNLEIVRKNKLGKLYGGQMFIKEEREPVINLSNVDLDPIIRNAMHPGLICHLKSRYDPLIKKSE